MGFVYVKKNRAKTQAFANQAVSVLGPGSHFAPSCAPAQDVPNDGVNPKTVAEGVPWRSSG